MSKLDNLVRSKGYKNFMAKLYGIGAAIVILGAMFKIMHWPGADLMIVVGMSTEAIIFLFSAIEPLHVEYDWSLVYPELAGMHDEEGASEELEKASGNIIELSLKLYFFHVCYELNYVPQEKDVLQF